MTHFDIRRLHNVFGYVFVEFYLVTVVIYEVARIYAFDVFFIYKSPRT